MTILGRHSVQEVLDYIKSQDWRFEKYNDAYKSIPASWRATSPNAAAALDTDWAACYKHFKETANKVGYSLKAQMLAVPFYVSANNVPAESEWQQMMAIFDESPDKLGSQRNCEWRIEQVVEMTGGKKVDIDTNRPLQNAPDTDIAIIKELDATTKAGEQAAAEVSKKAGTAVGTAVKSNIGLVAVGGIVLVGAGIVAAKVYL